MSLDNIYMNFKKKIVVLVGVHGSGKTTVGMRLKNDGFDFFPEIGTAMRKKSNKSVCDSQIFFDKQVLSRELERDCDEINMSKYPVIETWHIGNYAFALTRDSLISNYEAIIEKQLQKLYPLVIWLKIDDETFLSRNNEKKIHPIESLDFYKRLEVNLEDILFCYVYKKMIDLYICEEANYNLLRRRIISFLKMEEDRSGIRRV